MSIRSKIIFVVLPLLIAPFLLTGIVSALSARNGITRVATEFLVLAVDPYPKKPGAVFDTPPAPAADAEGPFAALAALKKDHNEGG